MRFTRTDVLKGGETMDKNLEKLRKAGIFACCPEGKEVEICDEDYEKIVQMLGIKKEED